MTSNSPKKRALLVGLTHVDATRYYGWDGRNGCHGCAKDVQNLQHLLTQHDWEIHTLLDADATCHNLHAKLHSLAEATQADDALLFYFSGHGGQLADDDGDEADLLDETLICYDGPMRDDTLNAVWLSCGENRRIYMLADCCNSGTNFKKLPEGEIIPKAPPIKIAADLAKSADSMRARLLHLGGCRDGYTSTGLRDGGVFTLALISHLRENPHLTWREVYNLIYRDVSETQSPSINLYPNLDNSLDTETALYHPSTRPASHASCIAPSSAGALTSSIPGGTATTPTNTTIPELDLSASILPRIDAREAVRAAAPAARASGPRLVAEGDSWFDFPLHPDVIDCLERHHGYKIANVSKAGACVYEMAYGPDNDHVSDIFDRDDSQLEEFVKRIREHRPQGLLLSGAGNDFVGPEFIMTIHHAAARKAGANMALVNALFQHDLEPAFERIIATATDAGRSAGLGTLPIFTHGYDYAIATGKAAVNLIVKKVGPWMDPSFLAKGYPRDTDAELIHRINIVRPIIDGLYEMLQRLRLKYPNLHVVNVRNTLPNRTDWHDELHPTREGFRKVAALFHTEIQSTLGSNRLSTNFPGVALAYNIEPLPVPENAASAISSLSALDGAQLALLGGSRQARETLLAAPNSDPTELLDLVAAYIYLLHDDLESPIRLPEDVVDSEEAAWKSLEDRICDELRFHPASENDDARTPASRRPPTYEERRSHYDSLFASCRVRPEHIGAAAWYVRKLREGERRYRAVGDPLNIPWEFIGIIHGLECSFRFDEHLHNGDPLSGRTVRVPAGHPRSGQAPFTWEDSAADALKLKRYHLQRDWSDAAMLYRFETYNGWGYFYRNLNSPYLWSFSQHYSRGKFVRDGVYDPNAVSRQCGAAVMLKSLRTGTRSMDGASRPLVTLAGGHNEDDPSSYLETVDSGIFDLTEENEPMDDATGETRASHRDQDADSWDQYPDFERFILSLRLRYFSPSEFLVKGNSHASGSCAGRNTHPPRKLWENIAATARVVDELRHRLGYPIRFLSVYRSPAYNGCISGAGGSMHMAYKAIDFVGSQGTPAQWAAELRAIRFRGLFHGGIGTYSSFVHVDTRGSNVDW